MEEQREAQRLMEAKPRQDGAAAMMERNEAILTPAKIVDNLGMNPQQQLQWTRFLRDAAIGSPNEIILRQTLFQKFRNERLDPDLRSAIFQRAMSYVRDVRKSLLEVYTPDELRKARQVTPVGGTTPGGYKKVAEGQYVKVDPSAGRQLGLFGENEQRPKPMPAPSEPSESSGGKPTAADYRMTDEAANAMDWADSQSRQLAQGGEVAQRPENHERAAKLHKKAAALLAGIGHPAEHYHWKEAQAHEREAARLKGGSQPKVAPPAPPKQDLSSAQEYVEGISNPAKKKYATQYLKWMEGGEEGFSPDPGKLRPEVAETVRMMLRQGEMGKSRRFVIYPDRLQKCNKCQGGFRAILRRPIRRADVLKKPEGGLADQVAEGDEELERCMKAGQQRRGRK